MPVTVSGSVGVSCSVTDQRTSVSGALNETGSRTAAVSAAWAIATGTAAGLADKCWSDIRSPAGSATEIIDCSGLVTNAFGSVESFVKVRAVVIVAASTNTTTLQIARPAGATGLPLFAAVSDALAPLSAGGFFGWADPAAGVTVTAGTGDLIHVINSAGATASFTIAIIGTSA